jgi:ketosteroid isomerase-like protein
MLSGLLRAEEALPPVQRELRARKFYFGAIDGRASDETVAAIKKFQLAKAIDQTGNLDDETLRALGLPVAEHANRDEARLLDECCTWVLRYFQARQSNDWERTAPFYADEVDYYFERGVKRTALREVLAQEDRHWPQRKYTMLNRIASLLPGRNDAAQVTARVRTQATGKSGSASVLTEDLIFRLRKTDDGWRIIAVKLLE